MPAPDFPPWLREATLQRFLCGLFALVGAILGGMWLVTTHMVDRQDAIIEKLDSRVARISDPGDGYPKAIGAAIGDLKQTLQASLDKLAMQTQQQGDSLREISANTAGTTAAVKQLAADLQDVRADVRQVRDAQAAIKTVSFADPSKDYFNYVSANLAGVGVDPKQVALTYAGGQLAFLPVGDDAGVILNKFKQAGWKSISVSAKDVAWIKPTP